MHFYIRRSMLNASPARTVRRSTFSSSFPFLHLLRERTLRAIGIVLQTKVFVNLEQTLPVRDRFQKLRAARIVREQARRSSFLEPIGKSRRKFCVFAPRISILCSEKRKHN